MIDLNKAALAELLKVPGISRGQAQALVARRPFTTWAEVRDTPGMTADVVKWLQAVGLRLGEPLASDAAVVAGAARGLSAAGEPSDT